MKRWKWGISIAAVLLLASVTIGGWHRHQAALQKAAGVQHQCDEALQGADSVKVWAAGMREAKEDRFCGRPGLRPRVIDESSDPGEVAELLGAFRCRPFNDLGPHVKSCSR